ncbi:uncharacterized protein FMAN_06775 [Fusarium mangiferae]|uniref:Clr5 domain-containing protein n=1 Tax=Fusarium mangiferae TaxID=192010 RepID=A0A1L7SQZ8_FUSMA|nr:uncharacterized protein FMAN_06775 [Fusarium mangiferae]CVK85636.1 uncharacterized protein FMAN_06775 [Fusarium mangiferae]
MDSSNLKWVYGSTDRAKGMSNETVDEYKTIIQQLYLDRNMTREGVLDRLKSFHGFSLSSVKLNMVPVKNYLTDQTYCRANQFSKATKRWGFYKQSRQVRARIQPSGSIIEDEELSSTLNLLKELFDHESDVLDSIDETEACFHTGSEYVKDPQTLEDVQKQLSYSEVPPSINHSVDFQRDALPCNTDKSLPERSKGQLQQLGTARKLEIGPDAISSKLFARTSSESYIDNKSRVDYLTCCYLLQEAVDCLETSGKTGGKREDQIPRSNTDKPLTKFRRDKDKLSKSEASSLDMWSVLCLEEPNQLGILDDLLNRPDMNDLQLTNAVKACLRMCEGWIELVVKGLPRGALQFDSLLLHQNARKAVQNMYRPVHEQGPFDLWQEAGYLFAFVWSNEQIEAANSSSWLKGAEISGLSRTYFLAIVCRMIVYRTVCRFPDFRTIQSKGNNTGRPICRLYLHAIGKMKKTSQLRDEKRLFIICLYNHHAGSEMDPKQSNILESVQSYQRKADDFVFNEERDTLAQEILQATTLHEDVGITNFSNMASSRSSRTASHSSSYSYTRQQHFTLLSSNPTMTRSLASGSSRGSSLNSFKGFQAASRAIEKCLKEDHSRYI